MYIAHIAIQDFGGISSYNAALTPELNCIPTPLAGEIATAIGFLLCSKAAPPIPAQWLRETTRISAQIHFHDAAYTVRAILRQGQLQLFATDPTGADATDHYQYTLSHCAEQDELECFDGQDSQAPLRLHRYFCQENPQDLTGKTQHIADTETFRGYLYRYIRNFTPEPIHSQKNYLAALNPEGVFYACYPGCQGNVFLSETEEKLFFYICFLNVAEFWTAFAQIRDLHHEKKPLLIRNFWEFLDASANINPLIRRTKQLQRQIIILTSPQTIKKGERNA